MVSQKLQNENEFHIVVSDDQSSFPPEFSLFAGEVVTGTLNEHALLSVGGKVFEGELVLTDEKKGLFHPTRAMKVDDKS